jgi:hypothetical protein
MLLIYETAEDFASRSQEQPTPLIAAWRAYYKALVDAGVYVGGAPLAAPPTGATVRVHGGQRRVQDGPYADTKEQLGGQIVLDVASLDEALDWAARCPTAATGAVEVRALSSDVRSLVEGGGHADAVPRGAAIGSARLERGLRTDR